MNLIRVHVRTTPAGLLVTTLTVTNSSAIFRRIKFPGRDFEGAHKAGLRLALARARGPAQWQGVLPGI